GSIATVNGGRDMRFEVRSRAYRFRILNASNARTYLLGFADAAGRAIPFTLLGVDGGLLAAPVRCEQCFLSSAERIDVLLDLSNAAIGDAIVLETRAFDPMHFDAPPGPGAAPSEHVRSHAHAPATEAPAKDAP